MLLTSFYIDSHKFDVYSDEASAYANNSAESFVLSLEDIRECLHCDNIATCTPIACPVYNECVQHENNLPYTLISRHCPELLVKYPEYLI